MTGDPKAWGLIRLGVALVESWMRAERNLLCVYNILMAAMGYKFIKIHNENLPRSVRLNCHFEEGQEKDILKIAIDIRCKFVVLLLLVSFFVSLRSAMCKYEINNVKGLW